MLTLAGCTGDNPAAVPTPSVSVTTSPTPTPPPPILAPLTGRPVPTKTIARRGVLAIKIDNAVPARPHIGLDKADVVYEEPVEGGITRFIALFQSRDVKTIGPIRSGRLADIDILRDYGRPILAYSGAAGYVSDALKRSDLILMRHGAFGSLFWRDRSRYGPHNLMSSTGALYRNAPRRPLLEVPPLFSFDRELPDAPTPSPSPSVLREPPAWPSGRTVRVPFSSPAYTAVWRYDEVTGLYRRWHGSRRHKVVSGRQITAANVIVMKVRAATGTRRDGAGNTTPQLTLVGSGAATLLRDGVRIRGTWHRASLGAHTTFVDTEGRPFVLAPGNSWIELLPTSRSASYS
jgi:hypothetical protein